MKFIFFLTGTEDIYMEIYSTICSKYDKTYTYEVREKILGTVEKDSCAILTRELNLPVTPQDVLAQQHQLEKDMLPKTTLMPGKTNIFLCSLLYKVHMLILNHRNAAEVWRERHYLQFGETVTQGLLSYLRYMCICV